MSEVPREYLGLARAFHAKVYKSDEQYITMRDGLWDALRSRLNRKPSFRLPECQDLFRTWQGCPAFGRIRNHASMHYTKRRVKFTDARLTVARRNFNDGGSERRLGLPSPG
jgi:hypothetical protein